MGKYLGNSTYFQFSFVANMQKFQNSDILNRGARHTRKANINVTNVKLEFTDHKFTHGAATRVRFDF